MAEPIDAAAFWTQLAQQYKRKEPGLTEQAVKEMAETLKILSIERKQEAQNQETTENAEITKKRIKQAAGLFADLISTVCDQLDAPPFNEVRPERCGALNVPTACLPLLSSVTKIFLKNRPKEFGYV